MPAKRDIDFNNKKAYGLKNVTLKDQDATPVGDLLLKDVDQVLRIRDSEDQADKSVAVSSVPDLPASKITSETLALDRIPTPLTGKDADSVDGHNLDQDVLTTSTPTFAAVKTAKIYPLSDGTSAVVITKADGSTVVINVDTTNSRVGINQSAPSNALHVYTPNAVLNSFLGGISVYASDLNDANVGGSIRFGGKTPGYPTGYPVAAIKGAFENPTDFKGFLAFATSLGDGTIGEKMRLTSAGRLGINQTVPGELLDVKGFIKVGGGSGLRFSDGSDVSKWHFQYGDGGLKVVETGVAEQHHFADGGKVGIKKISPAYTLDVGGDIHLTGDHVVPVKDAAPSDTPPVGTMRFVRLAANQNRIYVYTADGWQWHHFGGAGLQWWSDGVPYP